MKSIYLLLTCALLHSCTIAAPDEEPINIKVVNNSQYVLESLTAYSISFGNIAPRDSTRFQWTELPIALYRSRGHQIGFTSENIAYRGYGPHVASGHFTVRVDKQPEDSLFTIFVTGESRKVQAEVFSSDLTNPQ